MTQLPRRSRRGVSVTSVLLPLSRVSPAEDAVLGPVGEGRRREFSTGRACAAEALRQVGASEPGGPLPRDADGLPVWPRGFVGSISHTQGWVGAVATRTGRWRGPLSLGLDAEPSAGVDLAVLDVVANRSERGRLVELAASSGQVPWETALFVAKEAAYKAWFPRGRELLGHDRVTVDLSASGRFSARVTPRSGRRCEVRGRWVAGTFVVAVAAVVP